MPTFDSSCHDAESNLATAFYRAEDERRRPTLEDGEPNVSRKRKKRPRRPRRPLAPAKYPVGSQVRARPGRTVPDFSDIPLGGWSGTISEVDHRSDPPTYRIEWDRRTLDGMHPVYRKRCERDGLDHENMWLGEGDIEPDTGEPAAIEQPTNLLCRPLSKHDQDDRIRAIFGLTSDDPLPLVNKENLGRYHRHLESHLAFPFQATYRVAIGPFEDREYSVRVDGLLDPDESDEEEGLLCEAVQRDGFVELPLAEIEVTVHRHNGQLIDDYSYWFTNWPGEGSSPTTEESLRGEEPAVTPLTLLTGVLTACAVGGFYGAVLGAALASLDGVFIAVKTGGTLLALVGCLLGANSGDLFGAVNRMGRARWRCGFIGLVLGAGVGAMLGAMLIAFVGAVLGGLAGGIVLLIVRRMQDRTMPTIVSVLAGAMLGVAIQAWRQEAGQAWTGGGQGGIAGAIAGPILMFALGTALTSRPRDRE